MTAWASLSPLVQDLSLTLALLLPVVLLWAVLRRGTTPGPLIAALLWRYRGTNLLFILLIALSVAVSVALLQQERGLRDASARAANKFDMIVSPPGSEMTMMLATVYLQPTVSDLLDGATFGAIASDPRIAMAAPLAFGDSYEGAPVVGTTPQFVDYFTEGALKGRPFQATDEAIVGAEVPLTLGARFTPAHGHGAAADTEAHHGAEVTVVGRMAPTGSPWDRAILMPIEAVWQTHGLADGHAPERAGQIGPPFDPAFFPGTPAVVVKAKALWQTYALRTDFTRDSRMMAFFPGAVLNQLYGVLGDVRRAVSALALVSQAMVAAATLAALGILMRLFRRPLAVLAALGAPSRFILSVIWSYCATLITLGVTLGFALGISGTGLISRLLSQRLELAISPSLGWSEVHLAAAFLAISCLFALLPALWTSRQPILENLRR